MTLDIWVMREAVMVSSERKTKTTLEQNGQKRSKLRYGSFSRTISLPAPVDNSNVQADYPDDILMLDLLRAEGIVVLGIQRSTKVYIGAPQSETTVVIGDLLTLYGRDRTLARLNTRV